MPNEDEKHCTSCGEFYHPNTMRGDKCYSCFEDSSLGHDEYFADDEILYEER